MNLNEYQIETFKTATYPEDTGLYYTALGLAGEAGEVCNKVKKVIRDNNGILPDDKRAELKDEVGDVLWYVSELSRVLGFSLADVAAHNIKKLASRQQRGVLSGSGDAR